MNNEQLINKLNEIKKAIKQNAARTNNFFDLAKMSGRDPKNDFSGRNLNKLNLSCGDLQGANLQNANLISANLTNVDLSSANLSGANLSFANLTGADLRDTNFKDTKVENARFGNNKGLSESMKFDLLERGAIFESTHLEYDVNIKAYERIINGMDQKLRKNYLGKYVAFVDGELVDSDKNRDNLTKRINLKYPNKNKLIEKVDDQEREIIDIPINWS
ncbi:putative low-complexity protein [Xenococcus sp. PCC 7305]|uniref:pentapeptide repeat-containing protein n=1 Tax=Xenococcus sp. PCC 7305 TaxID=102125 RepID=UPI0002ACB64A|nr:pentapeptide repeat-containing protein [Xenococcus sp. PCC 7305]ELS03982.1 putative low-complexity protein [Xenococcus sp. PCC 7305]